MKHSGVDVNCRGRLHVLLLILTLNLRFPHITYGVQIGSFAKAQQRFIKKHHAVAAHSHVGNHFKRAYWHLELPYLDITMTYTCTTC